MAEGDVDEPGCVGRGPADHPVPAALGLRDLRDAVVGEDLQGEVAVPGRHESADLRLQLVRIHLVHPLVLGRDDDVHAIGLLPDVLVDPRQLDLELFGVETDGAEHADPARVGNRRDHVSAVGEGEDGEFDAELATDLGVHGVGPLFSVGFGGEHGEHRLLHAEERAEPAERELVVDRVGVDALLDREAVEKRFDQYGQLLGIGRGTGPDPSGPAGELTRAEPARLDVARPEHRGDFWIACGTQPELVFEQGPALAGPSSAPRATFSQTAVSSSSGDADTATSARSTVSTEFFHDSRSASKRPCLLPKCA